MRKIFTSIFCFILVFIYINDQLSINTYAQNNSWPVYPDIFAEAGVVIDASTGAVLYNKNMNQKMYPASITKILTSLIALENSTLDENVEFSHDAVYSLSYDDANIGMKEGESLSMNDTLHAVLLASANEAANAVAEHVAGSADAFAKIMNERAKEAGALNSNFENPSGLFNENHYTTCYDMAMITRDAIKNQQFLNIEKDTSYTIGPTNMTPEPRYLTNRHKMLFENNSVYYEGVLGGKTGYVDQSGNTLVTFAKRGDMTLISVVMKSDSSNVYLDTTKLLDYGFNNFKLLNISENENAFSLKSSSYNSSFSSVFGDNLTDITMDATDYVVIPKNAQFTDLIPQIEFNDRTEDNIIATIQYKYGDQYVGSTSIKLNNTFSDNFVYSPILKPTVDTTNEKWSLNINFWVLLGALIIIFILLIIFRTYKRAHLLRKRRRMQKRNKKRK